MKHGVYTSEQATSVISPIVAASGVPFVVGASPIQSAANPAAVNTPVLCNSWDEAVEAFGYSDDWDTYPMCEAMYAHFKLYGCKPAVFVNVLDTSTMKKTVAAAEKSVTDHKVELPIDAIDSDALSVVDNETTLVKGTDFETYYSGEHLIIALKDGTHYGATALTIGYAAIDATLVTDSVVTAGIDAIELCITTIGEMPDLILAPGYSHKPAVAAVMATKATKYNDMCHARALIDIDAATVTSYSAVAAAKSAASMTDPVEIVCWPMVKLGDKKFHLSTHLAGVMATVDSSNDGIPYESPSNKQLKIDAICLANGTAVTLKPADANTLNGNGVVTALNSFNGWVVWGNYTACYPSNTDVKDSFISVGRMFAFVANTLVRTFWGQLDKPMTRRLIDTILDTANIWMSGLVGSQYLLGARVEFLNEENPLTNLLAGKIKLHVYMTPPTPAQEINFVLEFDVDYVQEALS